MITYFLRENKGQLFTRETTVKTILIVIPDHKVCIMQSPLSPHIYVTHCAFTLQRHTTYNCRCITQVTYAPIEVRLAQNNDISKFIKPGVLADAHLVSWNCFCLGSWCVCMCPPPRAIITTHVKWTCNNRLNKWMPSLGDKGSNKLVSTSYCRTQNKDWTLVGHSLKVGTSLQLHPIVNVQ